MKGGTVFVLPCFAVRPPRTIVHIDADAFFAAVEQAADVKVLANPGVGGEARHHRFRVV
jgi:hypothetical protein